MSLYAWWKRSPAVPYIDAPTFAAKSLNALIASPFHAGAVWFVVALAAPSLDEAVPALAHPFGGALAGVVERHDRPLPPGEALAGFDVAARLAHSVGHLLRVLAQR